MKKLAVVLVLTLALVFVVSAVGHVVDAKGPPDHAQNDKKDTDTGNGNGNGNGNGGNGIGNGPPHTPPGPPETPPGQILVCVQHKKGWPIKWHPKHAVGFPWTVVDDSLCENGGGIPDDPDDDDPGGDGPDEDIPVEVQTPSGTITVYVKESSNRICFDESSVLISYQDNDWDAQVGVYSKAGRPLADTTSISYDLTGGVFHPNGCSIFVIQYEYEDADGDIFEIWWDTNGNPTYHRRISDSKNQQYLYPGKDYLYYSEEAPDGSWDLYKVKYGHWNNPELVMTDAKNPFIFRGQMAHESGNNVVHGEETLLDGRLPKFDWDGRLYLIMEGGFYRLNDEGVPELMMSSRPHDYDFFPGGILGISDGLVMEYSLISSSERDYFQQDEALFGEKYIDFFMSADYVDVLDFYK
jgi:hypothetical protein